MLDVPRELRAKDSIVRPMDQHANLHRAQRQSIISPGKFEEFVFYDHPSGYERVHAAMVWLKENQAIVSAE